MPPVNYALIGRYAWLLAPSALVFARVAGLAWTAPGWSSAGLQGRFRVILALTLTILVAPIATRNFHLPRDVAGLAVAGVVEVIVGAALGATAALVVAGARQAGELVGAQAGLSPASLLDPDAGDGMNVLGHLYGWVALGVFLSLGGPTELVRGVVLSYEAIPVGGGSTETSATLGAFDLIDVVFSAVARALALALRAASPPALALLIAGLAFGLLGRAAPSLQLVSLSLPIRTALGLILASLGLITLAATLNLAWQAGFPFAPGLGIGP